MIRAHLLFRITCASLLFLSACESLAATPPAIAHPSQAPTQIEPVATSLESTPALEPGPTPPQTSASPSHGLTILPTNIQHHNAWDLHFPYSDSDQPQLISLTSDGYRLDPSFQVASIELSYRWIGIGDSVRIYQRVERRGDAYWRSSSQVSADAVKALVQSVTRLHPQPRILSATTHTDDYPSWAIELTGLNGNHVLLYSESNSPGFVPWNVIYNGEIYAGFDAGIAAALGGLFEVVEGETLASFWPPDQTPGYLTVVTTSGPAQLSYGFSGLLPLYDALVYHPDPLNGELRGRMRTLAWNEASASMIAGSITDLQKIELEVAGHSTPCSLELFSSSGPENLAWDFVCPVGTPGADPVYRYPISVTFATSADQVHTLSGELFGYWEPGIALPAVPYPEEIGVVLESSPVVRDLLRDHQVQVLKFVAEADPERGLLDYRWEAELALLGQAQIGTRLLPYTVSLQAGVEASGLAHWDLDRTELLSLLGEVLDQAITTRFLDGDPNLVLNLYYGEKSRNPIVYPDNLKACANLPVAAQLPSPGYPLRGFGFNQPWDIYVMQVLLLGDGLRINHLDIKPGSPEDAVWTSLLPPELKPVGVPPLRLVFKRPMAQAIGLYWDESASPTAIERYKAIFESWNVPKEAKDLGVFIDQVMFDITPDGQLALVFCQAP